MILHTSDALPSTDNMKAFAEKLPLTLHGNRKHMWLPALLVFGATFFVLFSFFRNGGTFLLIWSMLQLVLSFFIGRAMFFRPLPALTISAEGFKLSSQNEGQVIPWAHIEKFSTVNVVGSLGVTYNFSSLAGRSQSAGGFTLPNQFDVGPIQMADALEKCRVYFTGRRK